MSWTKVNLVTKKDRYGLYDLYKCSKCHYEQKIRGLYPGMDCPKCLDKEDKVFGFWVPVESICHCVHCNDQMIKVPRTGHELSKYWSLQHNNQETLLCCPNGCREKSGRYKLAIKRRSKLKIRRRKNH